MRSKNGLIIWLSVLAGGSSLSAASGLAEWVDPRWLGIFAAVIAAANQGTAFYVAIAKPFTPVVDDRERWAS